MLYHKLRGLLANTTQGKIERSKTDRSVEYSFRMPQSSSFRDNSWIGKSRMALVVARYLWFLKKIDWSLWQPWNNYDLRTRNKNLIGISYVLFTAPSVFAEFKMFRLYKKDIPRLKLCVKGGVPFVVNLLCNHDHTGILWIWSKSLS